MHHLGGDRILIRKLVLQLLVKRTDNDDSLFLLVLFDTIEI